MCVIHMPVALSLIVPSNEYLHGQPRDRNKNKKKV